MRKFQETVEMRWEREGKTLEMIFVEREAGYIQDVRFFFFLEFSESILLGKKLKLKEVMGQQVKFQKSSMFFNI